MKYVMTFLGLLTIGSTASADLSSELMARHDQKIDQVIEIADRDLSCSQASDCTAIAIGKAFCGGPGGYIVTSAANSSIPDIKRLSDEISELHSLTAGGGICSLITLPSVLCENSRCGRDLFYDGASHFIPTENSITGSQGRFEFKRN